MNRDSRVGVLSPAAPDGVSPADFGRKAEALGFESVWVGEHPAIPRDLRRSYVQLEDGEVPYFYTNIADPWTTLAVIAGATSRIRLGTAVGLVVQRHPLNLAKILATLDRQSGGRLVIGAGAGWLVEELELFGVGFPTRFERLEEIVSAMRLLWTEEEAEFHGRYVDFPPVFSRYPPLQRPIPVLVGIHGPRGMGHAARWGDGWLPVWSGPDQLSSDLEQLGQLCDEAGRDVADLDVTTMLGIDEATPDDEVARAFDAGATRVILALGTSTTARTVRESAGADAHPLAPGRYEETLEEVAERYLPRR